jgi:flagellar hook assembly protein FlgD
VTPGPLEEVRLVVYDMTGRLLWRTNLGTLPAGEHNMVWDGKNSSGQLVAAGTYFYRLEHRTGRSATKMLTVVR